MNTEMFLQNFIILSIITILGLSLYGIIAKPNLIKKIIALTIFSDTANILAILVGFRKPPSIPPILTAPPTNESIREFQQLAVDPLPQALVLTAVVIGMAVNLLVIFIALQVYRLYRTTDMRKIRKLRG